MRSLYDSLTDRPSHWRTSDDRVVHLYQLDNEHLQNAINYCDRFGHVYEGLVLRIEQYRRNVSARTQSRVLYGYTSPRENRHVMDLREKRRILETEENRTPRPVKKKRAYKLSTLRKLSPCGDHLTLFQSTFGNSVVVDREAILKARKVGLNVLWPLSMSSFHSVRRAASAVLTERLKLSVYGQRSYDVKTAQLVADIYQRYLELLSQYKRAY